MIRIELLGTPVVRRGDGSTASPRGSKAWALLAYLLLTDGPAPRSRLASLLFPDAADPAATLRWNLAELRRALGPAAEISGDPVQVRLAEGASVDVLDLRAGGWDTAAALPGRGDELLAGVSAEHSPAFSLWLAAERRHVRQLTSGLLTDRARALLARGEGHAALALTRALVDLAPYDESAHAMHVRTLAEVEGRAAAEHALADAVAFLRTELEVEPSGALTTVLDRDLGSPRAPTGAATILAQLEAGRAAVAAGVASVGVETLSRAVVGARASGERRLLATALLEVGSAMVHAARGNDDEGAGALHEAAAIALELGETPIAATAHRELGYIEFLQADYGRAAWWLDEAERLAEDEAELAWIAAVRAHVRLDVGEHDQARRAAEAAVAHADRAAAPRAAAFALSCLGRQAVLRRELTDARVALDESTARARGDAWHAFLPWPESFRAEAALLDGDVDGAGALFDHAYAMGTHVDDPCWESVAARGLGLVAAARGETTAALDLLERAPRLCRRLPDSYRWVEFYALEALVATAVTTGSPQAASWATDLVRFAGDHGLRELQVRGLRHQAALGVVGAGELADALAATTENPALAPAPEALTP